MSVKRRITLAEQAAILADIRELAAKHRISPHTIGAISKLAGKAL